MKLRSGFVSNSSSQSFLIYGTVKPTDEVFKSVIQNESLVRNALNEKMQQYDSDSMYYKSAKRKLEEFENLISEYTSGKYKEEDFDDYEIYDIIKEVIESAIPLNTYTIMDLDDLYIGADPRTMRDEEKMGDWKNRIEGELTKFGLLNKDDKCDWLEECWRDG